MELVKPEPLVIGGRAHYTLTSYDTVSIELDVAATSEQDVELALQMTVTQMGGGPAELRSDAWVRENFEGLHNAAELRELIRQELMAMNAQVAEQQKAQKCADALAQRLMQAVPQADVARAQQMLAQNFQMGLQEQGATEAEFLAQAGMRSSDLQAMFAEQAKQAVEQEAAIDAWIDHFRLQISDDELPQYLGIPEEDSTEFMSQLRLSGQMGDARQYALRNKAMGTVIAEASCTYRHETPAQAQVRTQETRRVLDTQMQALRAQREKDDRDDRPRLTLV